MLSYLTPVCQFAELAERLVRHVKSQTRRKILKRGHKALFNTTHHSLLSSAADCSTKHKRTDLECSASQVCDSPPGDIFFATSSFFRFFFFFVHLYSVSSSPPLPPSLCVICVSALFVVVNLDASIMAVRKPLFEGFLSSPPRRLSSFLLGVTHFEAKEKQLVHG